MSKENIAKFQEALAQKTELSEKLKDVRTPEALVAAAQAEGFDFTAEELAEYGKATAQTGKLPDEEMDGVAGGKMKEPFIVTIGYGCTDWKPDTSGALWRAVRGQCGSCEYYRDLGLGIHGVCYWKSYLC